MFTLLEKRCKIDENIKRIVEEHRPKISKEEIQRRKRRLSEYSYIKLDYDYHVAELERIQASKVRLTSVLTGLPTGNVHKRPDDRWDEIIFETDELISYLTDRTNELLNELETLERAIDKLPPRERSIMTARYIAGMKFSEIIKKFPVSERSMYDIHQSGLEMIDMAELDEITLDWF